MKTKFLKRKSVCSEKQELTGIKFLLSSLTYGAPFHDPALS